MAGKFTNQLQAAILFDGVEPVCPSLALNPLRMEMLEKNIPLSITQESEDFVLLMGPDDLFITVGFHSNPAELSVFEATLRSSFVNIAMSDARERVTRHRSHVIVEVRHGVLPDMSDDPKYSGFLEEIGMPKPGHSLAAFRLRCDVMAAICRHIIAHQPASAVHWVPSNLLVAGEHFTSFSEPDHPGMLTVHASLYGHDTIPGYKEAPAGFFTQGASDYIGREIHMTPAPIPWPELYETALAFIRLAISENGYVIPDDDTFGPESGAFSYRVRHIEAGDADAVSPDAHYQLTLERCDKNGYVAPTYEPPQPLPDGVSSVAQLLDPNNEDERAQLDEFAAKESAALAAGGSLRVHLKGNGAPATGPAVDARPDDDYEADRPLDPNDPIDRAIMERLRQREKMESEERPASEAKPSGGYARSGSSFGRRKGGFGTRH